MGPASLWPHAIGQAAPEPRFKGKGCRPPPSPQRILRSYHVTGTALNTLLPASFHPRSNRTALAPRVVSRELNHVSKVSQWELELKLACVQSEI